MLRTDQFSNVIEMVENVFDGCRFIRFDKHSHACYSHYAPIFADFFDRFVGFAARMTVD